MHFLGQFVSKLFLSLANFLSCHNFCKKIYAVLLLFELIYQILRKADFSWNRPWILSRVSTIVVISCYPHLHLQTTQKVKRHVSYTTYMHMYFKFLKVEGLMGSRQNLNCRSLDRQPPTLPSELPYFGHLLARLARLKINVNYQINMPMLLFFWMKQIKILQLAKE